MDKKMYSKGGNETTIKMLHAILANTYVLYTKLWMFHVNYVGPDFVERHALLGDYKDQLGAEIDSVAEQVRKLCGTSQFSLGEFLSGSIIKDIPGMLVSSRNLADICNDFETLDTGITKAIDALGTPENCDYITQNLLIEIRGSHDKIKWFLKSIMS